MKTTNQGDLVGGDKGHDRRSGAEPKAARPEVPDRSRPCSKFATTGSAQAPHDFATVMTPHALLPPTRSP
jgi:hypothetical protein